MCEALKSHFSDCCGLWFLWTWALLVSKTRCFGSLSVRCSSWKLGCLLWDLKPLLLREKLWVLSSPRCGLPYQGWSLWYDCVPVSPTCFSAGPLSVTRYVGVTQFLGFFRGVAPYVAIESVYPRSEVCILLYYQLTLERKHSFLRSGHDHPSQAFVFAAVFSSVTSRAFVG